MRIVVSSTGRISVCARVRPRSSEKVVELIGPVKLDDWTSYLSSAFEGGRTAAAPMLPSGFTLPSLAIMEEVEL